MIGLPPYLAYLLGGMVGALGYGPVTRWVTSLRRALADQMQRPDAQRKDARALLLIFATMHPAPWLFILGVPFALYQLILGPLPWMWLRLIAGVLVGVALVFVYEAKFAGRGGA